MNSTLMEKLKKTEELRSSQPDIKVGDEYRDKFFKEEKLSIIEKINMKLGKNRTIVKICNKLKIEPIYLALIFIVPILILLLTFFSFTTRMITTLYPLYMSFKTLQYEVNKSKKDGKLYKQEDEDNDTTQWLSYWLLYSFVMNSELLLGSLVDSIPLYKFLKFLFLLSCFLPQIKLSVIIYKYFTSKLYSLYGENFENFILNLFSNKKNDETRDTHDSSDVKRKKVE